MQLQIGYSRSQPSSGGYHMSHSSPQPNHLQSQIEVLEDDSQFGIRLPKTVEEALGYFAFLFNP
jgi:ABC-type Na+ transport system ATPase subunit NatA